MNAVVFMQLRETGSAKPMERRDRLIRAAFSSIVGIGRNLTGFCRGPAGAAAETGGKLFR
jgi:hypothetical protein